MHILSPVCLTRHPSPFLLNCFTKDTFLQLSAGNQRFCTSPNRIKSLDMLILFPSFKQNVLVQQSIFRIAGLISFGFTYNNMFECVAENLASVCMCVFASVTAGETAVKKRMNPRESMCLILVV